MSAVMEEEPRRHRITVDQYYRMAGRPARAGRAGRIDDGEIIDMAPIGDPHRATVDWLCALLIRTLGEQAIVRCQGAVQLGEYSAPQPDFTLLAPREDDYYIH